MITILLTALLLLNTHSYANSLEKTNALHQEVATHKNPNITAETHPIIYRMIEELAMKAHVAMPRYITLYPAEYKIVSENGAIIKGEHEIGAYADCFGDLHICQELVAHLSFEEIQGILAIAIAEKAINKPMRVALTGITTFGVTLGLIYFFNHAHNSNLKKPEINDQEKRASTMVEKLFFLMIMPALATNKLVANYLQKTIDLKATELLTVKNVIDGLKGIAKTKEEYFKENAFSRIAQMLKLKKIVNTLLYPIRAFTLKERIDYLNQELKQCNHLALS